MAARVLVGISGGIAAFKAVDLVRLLRRRGHQVRCAMTRSAERFVAPLTLEILSGHAVYREEYLEATGSGEELHVTTAAWTEVFCVLPATAHTLARLALGLADDFLTTTALMYEGPLVLAPAMHSAMWEKEAVRTHLEALEERGAVIVGPVVGPLASGDVGIGRMAEPERVLEAIERCLGSGPLSGRRVLVTAGPTREYLDPVRFLSNRSSGKMGFALAAEAARLGAETILVSGPVHLGTPGGVERRTVVSATEMHAAVAELAPGCDLVIMAAAVADYRPSRRLEDKHKKRGGRLEVDWSENPDILRALADLAPDALRVGFAAETGNLDDEARRKLEAKRADFVVANDVSRADIGFDSEDNEVTVYGRTGEPVHLSRAPKRELARRLMRLFATALEESAAAGRRRAEGG